MWAIKKLNFDFKDAKEERLLQLNELEELRNEAYDIMLGFTRLRQRNGMIRRFGGENLRQEIRSCYLTLD